MITRKVPSPSPYICLRCRLSLSKRPLASLQRRNASGNSQRPPIEHYVPSTEQELERMNYRNRLSNRQSRVSGKSAGAQAFGKLYGHHGHARREGIEDLKTTRLNNPAKAIVLRDTIFNFYTYDKVAVKPKLPEHIDIERQLNEETGLVGVDEVNENISSLRPPIGQDTVDRDVLNALVQQLQEGFTTAQLEKYIELYTAVESETPDVELESSKKGKSKLRVTQWLPGTSEIEDRFDADPLRGYFLDSHTNKQRIALRLLRNCWGIELLEIAEGLGQFEIQVKPKDLDLLLAGPSSALDAICQRDLTLENEKIEVFRSRDVIRVTTTRTKRPWIISSIEQGLGAVTRKTLHLRDFVASTRNQTLSSGHRATTHQHFDKPMIQELGRLTNTSIVMKPSGAIDVSYLGEKDSTSGTTKMDDVKRLLLSINGLDRVNTLLAYTEPRASNTAFVKCPPSLTTSLPWFHRIRDWTRWTAPVTVRNTPETMLTQNSSPTTTFEAPVPHLVTVPPKSVSEKESKVIPEASQHWNKRYFTETSALVGTILHQNASPDIIQTSPIPCRNPEIANSGHAFTTHVPSLSKILSAQNIDVQNDGATTKNILVLRFMPNPFCDMNSKNHAHLDAYQVSAYPPIEMRFDIDPDTEDTELKDIRALVHQSRTDIMLPQNLVDIRFEQLTISRLQRRYLEQVKEYILKSKSSSGKLVDPFPAITLPVSGHLIRQLGSKSKTSKQPPLAQDDHEVDYLFTGLEIRSTLEFQWSGWDLDYTFIKAGRAGGTRSELRLRPIRNGERVGEEAFVRNAYLIADIIGSDDARFASDFVPKVLKPRHLVDETLPNRKVGTNKGGISSKYESKPRSTSINTISSGPASECIAEELVGVEHWGRREEVLDSQEVEEEPYQDDDVPDALELADVDLATEPELEKKTPVQSEEEHRSEVNGSIS